MVLNSFQNRKEQSEMSKQTNENGQGDKGIERREHTARERGLKAFTLLVNAVIMKCNCIGAIYELCGKFLLYQRN